MTRFKPLLFHTFISVFSMSSFNNPTYSIASTSNHNYDAPLYSAEPAPDERVLDRTLSSNRPLPTGTYSRTDQNLTVILTEQVDGTKVPLYGRRGLVKGDLTLKRPEEIVSVDLKVLVSHAVDPNLRVLTINNYSWKGC